MRKRITPRARKHKQNSREYIRPRSVYNIWLRSWPYWEDDDLYDKDKLAYKNDEIGDDDQWTSSDDTDDDDNPIGPFIISYRW